MPVRFFYQVPFKLKNSKRIEKWLQDTAKSEKYKINKVYYIFTDDDNLLSLNRQFLRHAALTDILTFDDTSEHDISAEIYISIDRVKDNTIRYGTEFQEELCRVIVHGLLHCCGYLDKSSADKKIMRSKENNYLLKLQAVRGR